MPLLVCIIGPTAIGKTRMGIQLAQAFQTEILSADSRQFFKEMTLGTAVPSEEELTAVKHHFIQNKSILESYSVGDFERDALALLKKLFQKHDIVVMVGGSGLYVDAVVKGLDEFPEVASEVREQLNETLKKEGLAPLQKELSEVDPKYFQKVDIQNPQRVIRALEVYRSSGKPFSSFRKAKKNHRFFDTLYIGLEAERAVVYDRINVRVDKMMSEGLLDEAKGLLAHKSVNALQTVGYRELFEYLEGRCSLEEAVEEIKKNTRRFSKRQGTWFRKNPEIRWFHYTAPVSEIKTYIQKTLTQPSG